MHAYISQNADQKVIKSLISHGFTPVLLAPDKSLPPPVASHADMLMLAVGDTIFVPKDKTDGSIPGFNKIVRISTPLGNKYPIDVPLNIAVIGHTVIANTKHASREVLDILAGMGKNIIHVSQGYAHCSTCIVSENAIISADAGIVKAALEAGIDALKISEGYISLPPYDYGFIGGACGTAADAVYFCGSLFHHPDGEAIKKFCRAHSKAVVELSDSPLCDVGGIIFK